MAMKVVRQARLELSGGSTPDLLRPEGCATATTAQGGGTLARGEPRLLVQAIA